MIQKKRDPVILVTDDAAMLSGNERRVHPIERDMLRRADRVISSAEALREAAGPDGVLSPPAHYVAVPIEAGGEPPIIDPFLGVPLKAGEIKDFATLATVRSEECEQLAARLVTPPFAGIIRKLRVEEGQSWRMIASQMIGFFHPDLTSDDRKVWNPPTNQLMGVALCAIAARQRGEQHNRPPWN